MAKVEATVIEKTLGHEKIYFNYIRRKSHNRMRSNIHFYFIF